MSKAQTVKQQNWALLFVSKSGTSLLALHSTGQQGGVGEDKTPAGRSPV